MPGSLSCWCLLPPCLHQLCSLDDISPDLRVMMPLQLLGFPLQLVGVLSLPWAYIKYVDEGNSIVEDIGSAAVS